MSELVMFDNKVSERRLNVDPAGALEVQVLNRSLLFTWIHISSPAVKIKDCIRLASRRGEDCCRRSRHRSGVGNSALKVQAPRDCVRPGVEGHSISSRDSADNPFDG